jgi:hypothetical protein
MFHKPNVFGVVAAVRAGQTFGCERGGQFPSSCVGAPQPVCCELCGLFGPRWMGTTIKNCEHALCQNGPIARTELQGYHHRICLPFSESLTDLCGLFWTAAIAISDQRNASDFPALNEPSEALRIWMHRHRLTTLRKSREHKLNSCTNCSVFIHLTMRTNQWLLLRSAASCAG